MREQRPAWAHLLARRNRARRQVDETPAPPVFSPLDIAGCVLWLDAANGALNDLNAPASNGELVVVWQDQSGSGNDATQATVAQQPQWLATIVNGRPVLRFDAADDGLVTPLTLAVPCTVFVVYAFNGTLSETRRAVQGSNNWLLGPYALTHDFHDGGFAGGPPVATGVFVAQAAWQDGAQSLNWVNGNFVGNPIGGGAGPGLLSLGAVGTFAEPLNGDVAEVIVYDSALSGGDMANVWAYLASKYGLS